MVGWWPVPAVVDGAKEPNLPHQWSLCGVWPPLLTAGPGPWQASGFVSAYCILIPHVSPSSPSALYMRKKKHSSDTIGALAVALGAEGDARHHHHGETDMEMWQVRVSVRTEG
jgi:hypothetical protein